MIGLYVRVERNGKFYNLDITELTELELEEFILNKKLQGVDGWSTFKSLLSWIKDNVRPE